MDCNLHLNFKNTHLPLRERIRMALARQKSQAARASALASATPEQLNELGGAFAVWQQLLRNREHYAAHMASIKASPLHYNSLASLGNQVEDARERVRLASEAVYGVESEPAVEKQEVEEVLKAYKANRGVENE